MAAALNTSLNRRLKSVAAAVAGTLGVLGLLVSVIGVWAQQTVLDDEAVAESVALALEQPPVTEAIAQRLADQIVSLLDPQSFVTDALREPLERVGPLFGGVVADGAQRLVVDQLGDVLARPGVRDGVEAAVAAAHQQLMRLLRGENLTDSVVVDVVVDTGVVSLNLVPLTVEGLEYAQGLGLLAGVELPTIESGAEPESQIAALEVALGRELPAGFGQIEVYSSDRLATAGATVELAQRAVVFAGRVVWLSIILVVVMPVLAIVLAARRRRAVMYFSGGTAATFATAWVVVRHIVGQLPSLVESTGAQLAVQIVSESLTGGLTLALATIAMLATFVLVVPVVRSRPKTTR